VLAHHQPEQSLDQRRRHPEWDIAQRYSSALAAVIFFVAALAVDQINGGSGQRYLHS
jgi:hypothetical protein